ncbi:hypothetical protein ACEOWJ_001617 [Bacillus cereus]|uniref:hypothetical protein n=1 Tax=Bacillus TaxID=1386 RepID=UPI00054D64C8|nr:hypothetical protein [Bacillus sp. UNC322MFChir4.1]
MLEEGSFFIIPFIEAFVRFDFQTLNVAFKYSLMKIISRDIVILRGDFFLKEKSKFYRKENQR